MKTIQKILALLGRLLLCGIFLSSGINKIMEWEQTASYMAAKGMPLVKVLLGGAILFEMVGGLSVVVGFKARIGATLLVVFLIPTTIIFHDFWAYEAQQQQDQLINFMKNLAILGGLFQIAAVGPGPWSIDKR